MRGYGHDGVVEVAHLDRGERYFLDSAVDASFLHCYPVALVEHLVACKAYSRHESRDGILEHEHEDGRGGTESCKESQRVAVDDYGDNHNHRQEPYHYLQYSTEGVEILMMGGTLVNIEELE